LEPGQHVFPFSFVSPHDIPPTREPKIGRDEENTKREYIDILEYS
jgi:hypothetical protein